MTGLSTTAATEQTVERVAWAVFLAAALACVLNAAASDVLRQSGLLDPLNWSVPVGTGWVLGAYWRAARP